MVRTGRNTDTLLGWSSQKKCVNRAKVLWGQPDGRIANAARSRPLHYDRAGDRHYDYASAFIKSLGGAL